MLNKLIWLLWLGNPTVCTFPDPHAAMTWRGFIGSKDAMWSKAKLCALWSENKKMAIVVIIIAKGEIIIMSLNPGTWPQTTTCKFFVKL